MVDYLDLVKGYLVGHTPTHAKMQQLEDSCTSDSASKESVVALRAKLRGLRGVMTLEAESWKQSIREVVDAHEWEARKGKYRQRVEGLISLPALMTAKLGIEVGLVCDVRSPYLPLNLLTERA